MEIKRQSEQYPHTGDISITYPPNYNGETLHGQDCDWCHDRPATTPMQQGSTMYFLCDACSRTSKPWSGK